MMFNDEARSASFSISAPGDIAWNDTVVVHSQEHISTRIYSPPASTTGSLEAETLRERRGDPLGDTEQLPLLQREVDPVPEGGDGELR